jgi:hypothetical protein
MDFIGALAIEIFVAPFNWIPLYHTRGHVVKYAGNELVFVVVPLLMNKTFQAPLSNQDLDRLHVRWILAKNRLEKSRLSASELTHVLLNKRLSWNDLTQKEKRMIEMSENYSLLNKRNNSSQAMDDNTEEYNQTSLVRKSYTLVQSLLVEMDKYRSKYYSDDAWDSYSPKQKKFAREEIFKNEFNTNPMDFGYITYKSMI